MTRLLFSAQGLVVVVLFFFWVWALFDCITTDGSIVRNLPKGVWLIIIIFLASIGSLAWLLMGRPERAGWRPGSTDYSKQRRAIGPEDSPGYLATPEVTDRRSADLDAQLAAWEKEQAEARERELRRREQENDED